MGMLDNKITDQTTRFFIQIPEPSIQSVICGNARMTSDMDTVLAGGPVVSVPPIFHIMLSFEAGEDKNDWNLLLAKKFVDEPVVGFCGSSDPTLSHAV